MRVLILILIMTMCVSTGLVNMEGLKKSFESPKMIKQVESSIKTTLKKIKNAVNQKMQDFKNKLSKYKEKILEKLHLTKEERQKLLEKLKLFKRRNVDQVQPTGDSIEEINFKVRGNDMFQGDMALSREQQEQVEADITGPRTKRQAYNDVAYPGMRWHNGVYFFFDRNASSQVRSVFIKAARQWMADTCINFGETKFVKDSIRVYMQKGCWSFVGRIGGVQNLSLGVGCESIGAAAHELGHALGLFHTHSRHDRDQFITVDETNIKPEWLDQFIMESPKTNNNYNVTYDYGSLMHYGATSSAIVKGKLTMVPKDVQYTETLGSPFIAYYDLLMINRHYKCFENCKGKKTPPCKNHGFPNPRNCLKCVCPSGYGGNYCEKRPTGCGDVLRASKKWKLLQDETGDRKAGGSPREDFMKCNYWIKAPKGKKIEVKIMSFTEGVAVDGCKYAGVEIKTQSDQRLSGHRFCSKDDANTVLKSDLNLQQGGAWAFMFSMNFQFSWNGIKSKALQDSGMSLWFADTLKKLSYVFLYPPNHSDESDRAREEPWKWLVLYMFVCLLLIFIGIDNITARRSTNDGTDVEIVHDQVLPLPRNDEQGLLTSSSTVPDWSEVKRRSPRYVEILLGVDAAVARHYGHEPERIRAAMLMLMHAVNMYAFQLDIRIAVVDVVPVHGYNVSLEQFLDWRQSTDTLAMHDIAILIRHRYEGGIAYVNGVCKRTAVGIAGFFPEAPFEYASVFFHELSHLLGLSHSARADCHCLKKNRGNCLRIDGFDNECSAQALVDLLPTIECLTEPKELPRSALALCGNGIVEEEEDCDCGPAKYCNNALCEPRTCRFIIARQYLYTTVTFGAALIICGFLVLIKRTFPRTSSSKIGHVNKTPFPSPHKPMLYCTDSPPSEFAPPYLRPNNHVTNATAPTLPSNVQLPAIACTPVRPAPKRPVQLTLDSPIPVPADITVTSEYVPMNPPKSMKITQKESALRLPSITSNRPKISDPIPLIIAGKVVNTQAPSPTTNSVQAKPTQDFIAALEDTLRGQTLDRKNRFPHSTKDAVLPKPPVPDRSEKPALRSFNESPQERHYDLPAVDP
ncbi:hypothetical protein GCK32_001458 [Trichostrongylus colubriformis]|uniref:Metalloendopeptidase n=1 Tax=Trichostrongylus colubriformis TaxID=6319 RepID=A0AAN8FL74_TRICO